MAKVIQNITSGDIQLSPNFYLSEFLASAEATRRGISNIPDPLAVQALFKTAKLLEQIRSLLGNRIISISSGFRCLALNRVLGSGDTSQHLTGDAADFNCRAFGTPLQVATAISKSGIKFGQLIFENSWVHISNPRGHNDGEILTAHFTPGGKTTYTQGL